MDLLPLLQSISTGVPWLDHSIRIVGITYVLYSIFLNILVQVSPDAKDWTWVRVSLALVANVSVIFSKIIVKQEPTPEPKAATTLRAPDFDPPTKPELKTRVENPKPPPPDGAA